MRPTVRSLARKPGFSLMVIAMFAVGIGANMAIFGVFNGMFLAALPLPDAGRLIYLQETAPKLNLKQVPIAPVDYYTWRDQNHTFESMSAYHGGSFNFSSAGAVSRVKGAAVTFDMGRTLGIRPVLGRDFLAEEDRKGGANVALLGCGLWERQFGGDRDVVGKILRLDNQPYTIIGVLPCEASIVPEADLWIPLQVDPRESGAWYLRALGRLKPGVSETEALTDLRRIHKAMAPAYKDNALTTPLIEPLRDRFVGEYRLIAHILAGVVGLLLLIACANVAGLILARGAARADEIAIRAALGAGRGRIVRLLLGEGAVLAAMGGAAGVLLGWLALRAVPSIMGDLLPPWLTFRLDARFAAFACAITALAALVSALAPAMDASRVGTRGVLADTAIRGSLSGPRRRALNWLAASEIALAVVLLVGAGLLTTALRKVMAVDPGFRPQNVVTFTISLPKAQYSRDSDRVVFFDELLRKLRAMPGVNSASAVNTLPLGGNDSQMFYEVEGAASRDPGVQNPVIQQFSVMPGYFRALGIELLDGRDFDAHDGENDGEHNGSEAVIVNQAFARHYWPGQSAIGKRIRGRWKDAKWLTVSGVARDVRGAGLDEDVRPAVFAPYRSVPLSTMSIALESGVDTLALAAGARRIVAQMDAGLPVYEVRTMTGLLEQSLWARRAYSWLFGVFAILAALLALSGIYGGISYAVSRRTREIGIRMALGAQPREVLRQVWIEGMRVAVAGLAAGLALAFVGARLLESQLAGVSIHDPWAYLLAGGAILGAASAANFLPARRAASVDPTRALRAE